MKKYIAISDVYTMSATYFHSWTMGKEYEVQLVDGLVTFDSDGGVEESMPILSLPSDFLSTTFGIEIE